MPPPLLRRPSPSLSLTVAPSLVRQVEGVLAIPGHVAAFQQTEKSMVSALGTVLKNSMMVKLRSDELYVVDLEKVGPSLPLARKPVRTRDLSAVDYKCPQRAIGEAERRYCGSLTEELTGEEVTFTEREKLAFGIDLRTCRMAAKFIMSQPGLIVEIVELRQARYVEFGMNAYDFLQWRKLEKEANEKAKAKAKEASGKEATEAKEAGNGAAGSAATALNLDDDDDDDDDVDMPDDARGGDAPLKSFFNDEDEEPAPPAPPAETTATEARLL